MINLNIAQQTVDEKTLSAIEVGQIQQEVAGWIFGVVVYNETTGEDYIYSEESGRNPFPVAIPAGDAISISASARNMGDGPQWMQLTVELIDPDGLIRRTVTEHTSSISPGVAFTSGKTSQITTDKTGTWLIHALLEADAA